MKALNDVVESGKVRYIGASSVRLFTSCLLLICYVGRRATDHTPTITDGSLGIPGPSECRQPQWLAPIHLDAKLL
jgi:hypothetical protein